MSHLSKKKTAIILIVLLIGLLIGFQIGAYTTIKAVTKIASGFIDEDLVTLAITQYRTQLGVCYPSQLENALNYSNSGK